MYPKSISKLRTNLGTFTSYSLAIYQFNNSNLKLHAKIALFISSSHAFRSKSDVNRKTYWLLLLFANELLWSCDDVIEARLCVLFARNDDRPPMWWWFWWWLLDMETFVIELPNADRWVLNKLVFLVEWLLLVLVL